MAFDGFFKPSSHQALVAPGLMAVLTCGRLAPIDAAVAQQVSIGLKRVLNRALPVVQGIPFVAQSLGVG